MKRASILSIVAAIAAAGPGWAQGADSIRPLGPGDRIRVTSDALPVSPVIGRLIRVDRWETVAPSPG